MSESSRDQLELYARDLQRISQLEREASRRADAMEAQLTRYATDLQKSVDGERQRTIDVEEAYRTALERLARTIDLRDRETGQHADRLTDYVGAICDAMGMSPEQRDPICIAAPLHDLGKVGVPDAILLKPDRLDEVEWKVMQSHCGMGASLLRGSGSEWMRIAHEVALTHHESFDGSGYPQGLRGVSIPLGGRIVKLADCYDTARSTRPHKAPMSADMARRAILEGDERMKPDHFDPELLDVFARIHDSFDEIFHMRGGR